MKRATLIALKPHARTARERLIIHRLLAGLTQAEIGRELGLSRARVNAIVKTLRVRAESTRHAEQEANDE